METKNKQAGTRRRIRNEYETVDPVKRREVAGRLIAQAAFRRCVAQSPEASNDDVSVQDAANSRTKKGSK